MAADPGDRGTFNAERTARAVRPRLRNQSSGASTLAILRPTIGSAAWRNRSTSRISGTARCGATAGAPRNRRRPGRLPRVGWVLAILVVGGCIGLIWLAQRIEPHWVSKDGQRFTCRVAELRPQRGEVGQWSEARVASTR